MEYLVYADADVELVARSGNGQHEPKKHDKYFPLDQSQ